MKKIKTAIIYLTIVAIVMFIINQAFGESTISIIKERTTNGVQFYTIDFWKYSQNIRVGFDNLNQLGIIQPTRQWSDVDIINNLAFIFDWVIMALNIIIWPIRLVGYIGLIGTTFIGIDINNDQGHLYWLCQTLDFILKLQIPYV